ncbi:MAG: preprotein translocase subunit SecG [Patescibacteria group bacterium]|jgi:preprotein translocase subunit SecG
MNFLTVLQTIIAVALIVVILLQQKGAGAGSMFGGGDSGNVFSTKRGVEKTLFRATIILALAFLALALANLIV